MTHAKAFEFFKIDLLTSKYIKRRQARKEPMTKGRMVSFGFDT